jgi:D-amino-acid dehydrogenase
MTDGPQPAIEPAMGEEQDTIIIGAGIIGVCAAAYLAEAGRKVTVIDRTGVCEETSSGNAAALAFPDVLPLVQKGMIRQLPRWLIDPLGPLTIPPSYLPRLLPWLIRFLRAGRADRYEAALAAQAALMHVAEAEWMALMERSATRHLLREDGALELYESEDEFSQSLEGWSLRQKHGMVCKHIARAEIDELQPGLAERFVRATFMPDWKTVADPKVLGKAVWAYAQGRGARTEIAEVAGAGTEGDKPVIRLKDGRAIACNKLVIAAGAWSHLIARFFGDRVPLETERGYNTTLPADAFDLRRQLIFARHGFVMTPLMDGIRVGGAVELAGLRRAPNYARAKAMLEKAKRFLPGLRTEGGREWMGYRPSLPDSLPVIDRAQASPNVFYAFGHGHLGLTQAAATGRLVRDLILGGQPPLDLAPFSARRF